MFQCLAPFLLLASLPLTQLRLSQDSSFEDKISGILKEAVAPQWKGVGAQSPPW